MCPSGTTRPIKKQKKKKWQQSCSSSYLSLSGLVSLPQRRNPYQYQGEIIHGEEVFSDLPRSDHPCFRRQPLLLQLSFTHHYHLTISCFLPTALPIHRPATILLWVSLSSPSLDSGRLSSVLSNLRYTHFTPIN